MTTKYETGFDLAKPGAERTVYFEQLDDHSILLRDSTLEECRERDLREFEEWWDTHRYYVHTDAKVAWMAARGHK